MISEAGLILPGGIWIEGERCQNASVRSIGGTEEFMLSGPWSRLNLTAKTSEVLRCCLTCIGFLSPVNIDSVRGMCLGDREALMLQLRRLTLGESIQALFSCPNSGCREALSYEMSVKHLLLEPYPGWQRLYESRFPFDGGECIIKFRLPNGFDQERAGVAASSQGIARAADELIRGCIIEALNEDGSPMQSIPDSVTVMLSSRMAELDPQAELMMNLKCPACGLEFESLFDSAGFFFSEIANMSGQLFEDIHMLAFYYNWPLNEILSLEMMMRRRFAERLYDHLRGGK
jgi:hypothetical protein